MYLSFWKSVPETLCILWPDVVFTPDWLSATVEKNSCLQTLSQNIRRRTGCGRSKLVQLLQHQTLRHSWSRATCLSRRDSDKERVKGTRSSFGRGIGWRMPAFCLGCLGCLKCFIPSFVPMLANPKLHWMSGAPCFLLHIQPWPIVQITDVA